MVEFDTELDGMTDDELAGEIAGGNVRSAREDRATSGSAQSGAATHYGETSTTAI